MECGRILFNSAIIELPPKHFSHSKGNLIYMREKPWRKPRARLGSRKTGLSSPVIFTDRSKAVLLLWFIFICYHIYNICLLHDFVATLRLSALPSAMYFVLSKLAL